MKYIIVLFMCFQMIGCDKEAKEPGKQGNPSKTTWLDPSVKGVAAQRLVPSGALLDCEFFYETHLPTCYVSNCSAIPELSQPACQSLQEDLLFKAYSASQMGFYPQNNRSTSLQVG